MTDVVEVMARAMRAALENGVFLKDCECDIAIRAALAALNEAGYAVEKGWQPIETAPRDGTHILVCTADPPYGPYWTFMQRPPTVAHWFGPPDLPGLRAGGFYLSVHEGETQRKLHPTHWMPLPEPPAPK